MTFNLGSLCMAILWNSIFIGIVFWIGKKKIYTTRKGIHLTLMFYLLGVVRMIFPIDFRPSIGIQVWKGVFPTVNYALSIQNYKAVYNSRCSGSNLADYCRGFHVALFCEIPGNASHFSKVFHRGK